MKRNISEDDLLHIGDVHSLANVFSDTSYGVRDKLTQELMDLAKEHSRRNGNSDKDNDIIVNCQNDGKSSSSSSRQVIQDILMQDLSDVQKRNVTANRAKFKRFITKFLSSYSFKYTQNNCWNRMSSPSLSHSVTMRGRDNRLDISSHYSFCISSDVFKRYCFKEYHDEIDAIFNSVVNDFTRRTFDYSMYERYVTAFPYDSRDLSYLLDEIIDYFNEYVFPFFEMFNDVYSVYDQFRITNNTRLWGEDWYPFNIAYYYLLTDQPSIALEHYKIFKSGQRMSMINKINKDDKDDADRYVFYRDYNRLCDIIIKSLEERSVVE